MSPGLGPKLIALSSPVMGSGKSEIAKRLVRDHGYILVKFADPVKRMVEALLQEGGLNPLVIEAGYYTEGYAKEHMLPQLANTSPRRLMQTLGTEWGRDIIHPGLWVAVASNKIARAFALGRKVVVDDLRFPNEVGAVERLGGVTFRVSRPSAQPYSAHRSEGALDNFPMPVIDNSGSLEELHLKADALVTGEFHVG